MTYKTLDVERIFGTKKNNYAINANNETICHKRSIEGFATTIQIQQVSLESDG